MHFEFLKDKTYALNRWWSGDYFIEEINKNSSELELVRELKHQIENLKVALKKCVHNNAKLSHRHENIGLNNSYWFSKVSILYAHIQPSAMTRLSTDINFLKGKPLGNGLIVE